MRLIDADALTKRIEEVYCKDCNNYNGVMCSACEHMDDMDFIEDAPTVDFRAKEGQRLIDADATKEKLGFAIEPFIGSDADEIRNDTLLDAIKIVDSMPTVDAQPVKLGRWIECNSQPNQKMCSSCRGVGVAKDIAQFFTYCPFCGAYMRGDKDGR